MLLSHLDDDDDDDDDDKAENEEHLSSWTFKNK